MGADEIDVAGGEVSVREGVLVRAGRGAWINAFSFGTTSTVGLNRSLANEAAASCVGWMNRIGMGSWWMK